MGILKMAHNSHLLFQTIARLLSKNESLSLYQIARMMHVDRHKIQNAVCKFTGMSFRGYQKQIKLLRAVALLENEEDISVKEVATLLHYRSPKAFSRFVNIMTGRPPRDIKKAFRTGRA
jgi:AraC-like DNA-binding protein